MSFLESRKKDLNEPQLDAVQTVDGPVLVLAGAGSGKTRVLTYRIAHLVQDLNVPLSDILAMTFSNKAAREMQERVRHLLDLHEQLPWISTFHSVGARLLRRFGAHLGLQNNFVIYDEGEQLTMVKTCLERLGINDKTYSPESVHRKIGEWKNQGRSANELENNRVTKAEEIAANVYQAYEEEMRRAMAVDFDDLLLLTYKLFKTVPDIKRAFRTQWRYILIDEFQDTNELQYKLLKEVLNEHNNICVVGDDDQSIYGWRGAKIDNILNFDKEYNKCKVIKLEQNYRSTGNILKAADIVISKNDMRHEKHLWTSKGAGEKIRYAVLSDDRSESSFVVGEIKRQIQAGVSPEEIAVLYRINSLSRGFEEECLKAKVPYRIIGGFRFYERKEIKDVLAYLRVLLNPADIVSFRRSVNTPTRGIGKTTIEKIETMAFENLQAVGSFLINATDLPAIGKGKAGLNQYRAILERGYHAISANESFVDLMMEILEKSNYVNTLKNEGTPESNERVENIQELMSAVQEFEESWMPREDLASNESALKQKITDFLERVSLISDVDQLDSDETGNLKEPQSQVTFMSVHAAKGLEFKVCFVCGLEEGIFPSARSFDDYQRLEEERRLCYVGITRAKDKLYLTRASRRRTFGAINANIESRFLKDIPKELYDVVADQSGDDNDSPSYSFGWSYGAMARRSAPKAQAKAEESFDFEFDQRSEELEYSRGDKIIHPSFGEGIVQASEILGSDECVTIQFHRAGRKKVLAKFVKRLN